MPCPSHKTLLILSDTDIELALRQRVGFAWLLQLVSLRLREDPLWEGTVHGAGDMLRTALRLPRAEWGTYLAQVDEIANAVVPTLYDRDAPDHEPLVRAYRHWLTSR